MQRLFAPLLSVLVLAGCQNAPTVDPFMNRAVVPPPPDGSFGTPGGAPGYYNPQSVPLPGPTSQISPPGHFMGQAGTSPGGVAWSTVDSTAVRNEGAAQIAATDQRSVLVAPGSVRPAGFVEPLEPLRPLSPASPESPLRIVEPGSGTPEATPPSTATHSSAADEPALLPLPASHHVRPIPIEPQGNGVEMLPPLPPANSPGTPGAVVSQDGLQWQPVR